MSAVLERHAGQMPLRTAIAVFLCFAFTYFFAALLRGVTATLAPHFSAELGLTAGDLGLLAGAFFLGFATTQLPLGSALDRWGSRRVLLAFLGVAVAGCVGFAMARDFVSLTLARACIGIGVSACLMAPMTTFRHHFGSGAQMRANSWMLMSGSTGMIASTLPVQWLMPAIGWRGLFIVAGAALVLAMLAIAWWVPHESDMPSTARSTGGGYAEVFRHPTFIRFAPLAFFYYGGLIAVQSLWAGPWLVNVCGWTAEASARGLFAINIAMLAAFLAWGTFVPRLYASGWTAQRLIGRYAPFSIGMLWIGTALGPGATAWLWVLFCAGCSVVSLAQPAVGQAFAAHLAGRALSAYNLLVFVGVFVIQWGLGLAIDAFRKSGATTVSAYQGAFALLAVCCTLSYVWFLRSSDESVSVSLEAHG